MHHSFFCRSPVKDCLVCKRITSSYPFSFQHFFLCLLPVGIMQVRLIIYSSVSRLSVRCLRTGNAYISFILLINKKIIKNKPHSVMLTTFSSDCEVIFSVNY